jgi:general secretion pathway protein K
MNKAMRASQRGAALLMAMLVVVLVATFAAASLWLQWRTVEVETAERARIQSGWILTGALDWSRLLLREDALAARGTPVDHLGEPWAVPLQEARLSSFLAANNNNTTTDLAPDTMDAFLSGRIVDLQSMMNVNNMVKPDGGRNDEQIASFQRLFEILNLPQNELARLAENLRFSTMPVHVTQPPREAPLQPRRLAELVWLGVSPQTVAVLEPYVTVLPTNTAKVNVNTASAEVIAASADIDLADAQRLVQARSGSYFRNPQDIQAQLPGAGDGINELGVGSDFFEVRARLRLDKLVVEERSVLQRAGDKVRVITRERGPGSANGTAANAVVQR